MIKVYFEYKGYAEHVASFESEETYMKLLPHLEKLAKDNGFERVTEAIEE